MGFSTLNTLLVQMLGQVFQGVFVLIGTYGSTRFRNTRTYFMAWNLAVALVGAVMIREIHPSQIWARFMGYCLCIAFSANFPMVLSMSSGNIGGFTKKNTANAMVSELRTGLRITMLTLTDLHRVLHRQYHRPSAILCQ
jgi:hypothetical protein